jgi:hypothetical protein
MHNPTVETNIMLEFLAKTLLGNMSLISTNKLFKSLLGLIFECCGIAKAYDNYNKQNWGSLSVAIHDFLKGNP